MVKSDKLYSPQKYLELVTGKCYIIDGDNDIALIELLLEHDKKDLWNCPLSEIDHIVEDNLNVVLVDCMVLSEDNAEYEHVYRWFEVPEDFEDEM